MSPCHCSVAMLGGSDPVHGIRPALARELDREHADLGRGAGVDARPERRGEQLCAQARPPERPSRAHMAGDRRLLAHEPRAVVLVVDAHGPAHRDDRVPGTAGQRLALVELDPHELVPALAQDVLEDPRRLARDVLQDEDAHHTPAFCAGAQAGRLAP